MQVLPSDDPKVIQLARKPSLAQRDLAHVWHPCSQMKDYETFAPLPIKRAHGAYLYLDNGDRLIDSNSSWWCKHLGHGVTELQTALITQCQQLEHVILANTTHEPIVTLSEKLCQLNPYLNKVCYASDGSCAVEMALKLSLHMRYLNNEPKRHLFVCLENGYHGETIGTLAVSDLGLYRDCYKAVLPQTKRLTGLPYISGKSDPLWFDCADHWQKIEKQLTPFADEITAIIVEPILQAAGHMRLYSPSLLRHLQTWAKAHDVHLISDEIMTGLGRTGKVLAGDYANFNPDFLCLGKGLTAGTLPLSAMLTTDAIYQACYDDYDTGKAFMHSHTHTGNALACAVANAALDYYEDYRIIEQVHYLSQQMQTLWQEVADKTGKLTNIRHLGAMVAADLKIPNNTPANARSGYAVYQAAIKRGALLRPLGNTLYWLPPLNCDKSVLIQLRDITINAINDVFD